MVLWENWIRNSPTEVILLCWYFNFIINIYMYIYSIGIIIMWIFPPPLCISLHYVCVNLCSLFIFNLDNHDHDIVLFEMTDNMDLATDSDTDKGRIYSLPIYSWDLFTHILHWHSYDQESWIIWITSNLTQWWYFFIIFEYILHISTPHIMIFCFPLPYFPLSTSALFFA